MKKSIVIFAAVVAAAAVTACSRPAESNESSASGNAVSANTQEDVGEGAEEGTSEEATTEEASQAAEYGILKGTVKEGTEDDLEVTITLEDGSEIAIGPLAFSSIETVIEPGKPVAMVYAGEFDGSNIDDLDLYLMLDQVDMEIKDVTGTTISNAMSTFQLKTDDGQEMAFPKDGCSIEEGAMAQDSGDHVTVTYVALAGGDIYPLHIVKAK